ncbi:hypothetical protein SAMN05421740_101200 [Parapedobacter koreensis]|uniref:Uncharacterized protein n=1 Tax=Parapedobacter koreensis TaxID=332977 RepID=A0A1H7F2P7_9SPHI|nr:hypothetical protein SAMN05421740_101200 [Parapedobacter koreensis]
MQVTKVAYKKQIIGHLAALKIVHALRLQRPKKDQCATNCSYALIVSSSYYISNRKIIGIFPYKVPTISLVYPYKVTITRSVDKKQM